MTRSLALLSALALLGGCQSLSSPVSAERMPAVSQSAPASTSAAPVASFSAETLYALLVAELAGQRERFDLALEQYVEQAHLTADPAVAERAFRIAEYLGAEDAALDTAILWARHARDNLDAQRSAAIQLARAGRHEEAMLYMEQVLLSDGSTHFDFLALSAAQVDDDTRRGLLKAFARLLRRYPDNSQLLFGQAVLLQQDGRLEQALAGLSAHPAGSREINLLLLRTRLLNALQRGAESLPLLEAGLDLHPDDKRLRLTYARQLLEQAQYAKAREQFAFLLAGDPDDDDLYLSLALLDLETRRWDEARQHLETLLERGSHVDTAHFQLGRLAEQDKDIDAALRAYGAVGPGNEYLPAQLRRSELLLRAGRGAEALQQLADARQRQPDYALQLYQVEIDALSRLGDPAQAWQSLAAALQQFPEDLNLLYVRAMLAEQRNDLVTLETDLRFILEREPENAMALNALGYTLADRTTRYAEALELITQAHSLNPDDPAILDSLGWVHYRMGKLEEAERWLRQAHARMPDQEIAAHLGEVLWIRGQRREARALWREAFAKDPEGAILRETLRRLTGKEAP